MLKSYAAIYKQGHLDWLDDAPEQDNVQVIVTLVDTSFTPKKQPDPLACSHPIYYPEDEISDGTAFTDIENAAEYGKQLRTTAWQRNHG